MSVTAPPKPQSPPPIEEPANGESLEALIEEARRRTRRRRRRYAMAALFVAGGIGGAAVIFGGSGGPGAVSSPASSPGSSSRAQAALSTPRVRNGPLTLADGNAIFTVDHRGVRHLLFRCQPGAGPRFCTVMHGIAWSPTGGKLLFSSTTISIASRYNGMHVLDLHTGRTKRAGSEGFSADWSRDGRIALVEPSPYGFLPGSIYIRRIDGATATEKLLATGTEGYDWFPSWSPDSKKLAFATRMNGKSWISIIDSDGSHRRVLARHASWPAWSPDGRAIAYRTPCGAKLITPDGTDVTPRTHNRCGSLGVRGVQHWSPDGRRIAIATRDSIYVMNRDGTHRTFIPLSSFRETYSPIFGPAAHVSWQPLAR